jgi:hypothetical protein
LIGSILHKYVQTQRFGWLREKYQDLFPINLLNPLCSITNNNSSNTHLIVAF